MTLGELSEGLGAAISGTCRPAGPGRRRHHPVRVRLAGNAPDAALKGSLLPDQARAEPAGSSSPISACPPTASEVFERNGARMLLVTAGIEDASLSEVIPQVQAITARRAAASRLSHLTSAAPIRRSRPRSANSPRC